MSVTGLRAGRRSASACRSPTSARGWPPTRDPAALSGGSDRRGGQVDVSMLEAWCRCSRTRPPRTCHRQGPGRLGNRHPSWRRTRPSRRRTATSTSPWATRRCGGRSATRSARRSGRRRALRHQRAAGGELRRAPRRPGPDPRLAAGGGVAGRPRRRGRPLRGRVRTVGEALDGPQIEARGLIVERDHPEGGSRTLRREPDPSRRRPASRRPCRRPLLGQHTAEVLMERLKMTAAEVDALRADGVV